MRVRSMRAEKFGGGKKSSKKLSKKSSKKLKTSSSNVKLNNVKSDKNKYTISEFMDLQAKNYASNMGIEY
jgi:hypothetical protein